MRPILTGQTVRIHETLTHPDRRVIFTSRKNNKPVTFVLGTNQVITGALTTTHWQRASQPAGVCRVLAPLARNREKSAKTVASADGLLIVNYCSAGRTVGVEITAPQAIPLERPNQLVAEPGEPPIAEQDYRPVRAV